MGLATAYPDVLVSPESPEQPEGQSGWGPQHCLLYTEPPGECSHAATQPWHSSRSDHLDEASWTHHCRKGPLCRIPAYRIELILAPKYPKALPQSAFADPGSAPSAPCQVPHLKLLGCLFPQPYGNSRPLNRSRRSVNAMARPCLGYRKATFSHQPSSREDTSCARKGLELSSQVVL